MLQDKLIEDLRKEIETNKDIEDIVIFGSAARTNFQKYNDIDVLIIFRNQFNLSEKQSRLKNMEGIFNSKLNPLLNYGVPLTVNYGVPFVKESKYHIFYCKQKDLKIEHPLIRNIIRNRFSIKLFGNDESSRYN